LTAPRLAQPSIAVKPGGRSRLFERSELRERRALREAQGTRVAGKPPGSPFFWVLFFGGAKKSTSPFRAKPEDEKAHRMNRQNHQLKRDANHSIAYAMRTYGPLIFRVGAHRIDESHFDCETGE